MSHTRHLINQLSIPFVGFRGIATLEGVSNPLLSIPFVGFYTEVERIIHEMLIAFNSLCWVHEGYSNNLDDYVIIFQFPLLGSEC